MGRPSKFSQEIVEAVCERIANGESLRAICMDASMPAMSSVFKWLSEDEAFSDQYARAREAQADTHFDEIVHIADTEEDPQRARVRIDARKWTAGKQRPKKYGDKLNVEHEGSLTVNVNYGVD
jgi:SpoVK/Ycf46/Vps4 family AAA+-type ATPase